MHAADLNLTNNTWSALFGGLGGNGLDGEVNTIVISGTDTYVGGTFTRAGPIAANYIARWNGSSWSALGAGVDFHVLALALQGNTLYVGGRFTNAGGNPAHYIAQWNTGSQTWSTLNSSGKEGVIVRSLQYQGSSNAVPSPAWRHGSGGRLPGPRDGSVAGLSLRLAAVTDDATSPARQFNYLQVHRTHFKSWPQAVEFERVVAALSAAGFYRSLGFVPVRRASQQAPEEQRTRQRNCCRHKKAQPPMDMRFSGRAMAARE